MTQIAESSLWLVPSEPALTDLCTLVRSCTDMMGQPFFMPHMTLLGDIPLTPDDLAKRLSSLQAAPIQVTLSQLVQGSSWFMSVYLTPQKDQSGLQSLRKTVTHTLGVQADEAYSPHISMVYGPVEGLHLTQMTEMAKAVLPLTLSFHSLHVVHASQSIPIEDWNTRHILSLA